MDRMLEQKAWYFRYKYYIMCGVAVLAPVSYTHLTLPTKA